MRDICIADTSCLILLQKIDHLEILRDCYSQVIITPEILAEFGLNSPDWIIVRKVADKSVQQTLGQVIGRGEASAIALGFEIENNVLILDDLKARKIAKALHFRITGTLGVITKAKKLGVISSVKPLLELLKKTDFRFSDKIIRKILEIANET